MSATSGQVGFTLARGFVILSMLTRVLVCMYVCM
jgi:hypothetical protein